MIEALHDCLQHYSYEKGVELYKQIGDDAYFLSLLLDRRDAFNEQHLKFSLERIYKEKLQLQHLNSTNKDLVVTNNTVFVANEVAEEATTLVVADTTLLANCKLQADKLYKQMMAKRTLLFSHCQIAKSRTENNNEQVEKRKSLALDILSIQVEVDKAYAIYDFVVKHGHLPTTTEDKPTNLLANIKPHDLKIKRERTLKNIRHLKRLEATPIRLQKLQEHTEFLNLLDAEISKLGSAE